MDDFPIRLKPEDIFRPDLGDYAVDSARTWVDPKGYRLSDRLWRASQADRKAIDNLLRNGMARGLSPLQTARELEGYLNPRYQPRRDPETFRILPQSQQPRGVVTRTPRQGPGRGPQRPGNSGLGSNATRRLARTETSAAMGRATLDAGKTNPLLEAIKWLLSRNHPEPDQCDRNASRSSRGLERGVYFFDEVPTYPDHPNEMCTLAHWVSKAQIDAAIPRLREYIRTGNLPSREWGEQAYREGRHIPLFDAAAKRRGRPPGSKNKPKEPAPEEKPAWVGEIESIRARELKRLTDTGTIDESEIRRAGSIVMRNYERVPIVAKHIDELDELGQRVGAYKAQIQRLIDPMERMTTRKLQRAAEARIAEIHKEIGGNPFAVNLNGALSKVRPMGSPTKHPWANGSSNVAKAAMKEPQRLLPRDWWETSIAYDTPRVPKQKRGGYLHSYNGNSVIGLSGNDPSDMADTAVHEFVHRMEDTRPGIVAAQRSFYEMRTAGEELQSLREIRPGHGYAANELVRSDRFANIYAGKEYKKSAGFVSDGYEIATMGVEDVYRHGAHPEWILSDTEYRDFIVGLLAVL